MNEVNETIAKFGYPDTVLKEYDHWVVLFRLKQVTVGSMIIAAKSSANSLGELSSEVWAEFATVSEDVEAWLVTAFGAKRVNYLALMMKDPNVHFHVIPRYDGPISVDGQDFLDPDWPLKTELNEVDMSDETKQTIQRMIAGVVRQDND